MITTLKIFKTDCTDPYRNIACEEELLLHVQPGECILYLWQNDRTVVIGRNQNAFKECRTDLLEQEGGHLARRLTGGGAVYHDLGNLNYSFVCAKEDYDRAEQTGVILQGLRELGINASLSGRNDILVGGRKFSGSAFLEKKDRMLAHATIMCSVDREMMKRYLRVSAVKLKSKGVDSVESRVMNLTDVRPDLTVPMIEDQLEKSFSDVYGRMPEILLPEEVLTDSVKAREKQLGAGEWIYGTEPDFTGSIHFRGSQGEMLLDLAAEKGVISRAVLWTDSLAVDLPEKYEPALQGLPYGSEKMKNILTELGMSEEDYERLV